MLILLTAAANTQSATIVVTCSIASAIERAQPGDKVLIQGPMAFHERLELGKPVRLVGTNAPVLDAEGIGTALTVSANGVQISGITIRNTGRDPGNYDSGILIKGTGVTVSGCTIDSDGFGVYLRDTSGCTLANNTITGSMDVPSAKRGNGIHIWKSRDNEIRHNRISNKRDGLYLSYADRNRIVSNRVAETRFGIHYMYSHHNDLVGNELTRNSVGATLMFSRQSLIEGNSVLANKRHGMVFKQLDSSRVLNNLIAGHNRGFFVQQATQNRFAGNTIATNDIGLYLSNCSEQNVFVANAFIQNTDQVWQPPFETEQGRLGPNKFTEKRLGNFWSDYTGSDRNQDGIGDTAYHETDVFGYIVDRHPEARVYALSPAVALLRKGEELMPVLDTAGVTDTAPLMSPPRRVKATPSPKLVILGSGSQH